MRLRPPLTSPKLVTVVLLILSWNRLLAAESSQPNIVVIMSDDMGYSDLGCSGGEIKTPNLDTLAAGGLRFTQFYNTARCCPTRAALLTGLHPHQAGIGHMMEDRGHNGYRGDLNRQCATMAEVLKPAGYPCPRSKEKQAVPPSSDSTSGRSDDSGHGECGLLFRDAADSDSNSRRPATRRLSRRQSDSAFQMERPLCCRGCSASETLARDRLRR